MMKNQKGEKKLNFYCFGPIYLYKLVSILLFKLQLLVYKFHRDIGIFLGQEVNIQDTIILIVLFYVRKNCRNRFFFLFFFFVETKIVCRESREKVSSRVFTIIIIVVKVSKEHTSNNEKPNEYHYRSLLVGS